MAENKNMRIWNQVDKSDPAYLKTVTIGRSFTAIDPQYQVMKATETFGPVGEGWGWTSSVDTVGAQDGQIAVMAHVTIWHGSRGTASHSQDAEPSSSKTRKATTSLPKMRQRWRSRMG